MSLRRVGFTTFATALFVGAVLLVLGPVVSSTLAACPGNRPLAGVVLRGVQLWPPRVFYSDGCNEVALDPSFAVALLLALVGLAVAGVGQARESFGRE